MGKVASKKIVELFLVDTDGTPEYGYAYTGRSSW